MNFAELVKTPDITLDDSGPIGKIVRGFNRATIAFALNTKEEIHHAVKKSYPMGDSDPIYEALKRHFKSEKDFLVVDAVPYDEIPADAVKEGAEVGVYFVSQEVRMGGYGKILHRVAKGIVSKGNVLVGKDALMITFPDKLMSVNRRNRYRVYLKLEEHFCEIIDLPTDRNAPIPKYTIRNISNKGMCVILLSVPADKVPEKGDTVYARISLFTPQKGYAVKRGVMVSTAEVTEGKVQQDQYVLKCRVCYVDQGNERNTLLGVEFHGVAREGTTVDPDRFPRLTYVPVEDDGVEAMIPWINRIQQLRRAEERDLIA